MKTLNAPGDLNLSRVLRLIWQVKGISRVEIAHHLGIDKSTVTKIVSTLEEIGIIRAFAQGATGKRGGRKPIQLEVDPDFGMALGIEINTDSFHVAVINLHGEIVETAHGETRTASIFESYDAAIEAIAPSIESRGIPLIGIGVGVPAIVNAESGEILQSIPLQIEKPVSFAEWATGKYGVPVHVDNDARCGCLGEIIVRHGMGMDNALFVLAEIRRITGETRSRKNLSVGLGFVINGQPLYGQDHSAGEFRSVLWKPGNSGQFQSSDIHGDRIGSDESVTGSMFAELASHVALLANALNLNHVFIGGLSGELTESLIRRIDEEIGLKWPYALSHRCAVVPASLAFRAVAYGAAGHCLQRFFSLPNINQKSGSGPSVRESLERIRVSP